VVASAAGDWRRNRPVGAWNNFLEEMAMRLLSSKEELNECLFKIIKDSKKTLKIVSPFVDFYDKKNKQKWNTLIELLIKKESFIEIYTLPHTEYNENKSVEYIRKALKISKDHITVMANLHAKIYINDNTALMSSMNLTYPSFNRSVDFGVITENEAEYSEVLDFCNKYIFINNEKHQDALKKYVVEYFSKKGIQAVFHDENCLMLEKNGNFILRCYSDTLGNDINNIALHLDVNKNDTDTILRKCKVQKKTGKYGKGRYYIHTEKCGTLGVIQNTNIHKEETLETIMDVCNCIIEQ
jgi:hypothetical protein